MLEIIDLHELCSSVSIAMLQMKTFLLGFLSFKKQTFFSSILAVFCIASLSCGMLARLSEEAIKTMFYLYRVVKYYWFYSSKISNILSISVLHLSREGMSVVRTSRQIIFFCVSRIFFIFLCILCQSLSPYCRN